MAGKFIVIEGTDGSGKGTQYRLLMDRLFSEGYDVATFDFPRYEEPSSYFVREYLSGAYGTADEVGPFRGAMFYAMDRYAASFEMRKALSEGKVVLSNRYVGSNMAHQGGKLRDPEKRRGYYEWCRKMELEGMQIPKPDLNIVLHVSAEMAFVLVTDRAKDSDREVAKRDIIHEADMTHLKNSEEAYLELCNIYPEWFTKIECMDGNNLLKPEQIAAKVWEKAEKALTVDAGSQIE